MRNVFSEKVEPEKKEDIYGILMTHELRRILRTEDLQVVSVLLLIYVCIGLWSLAYTAGKPCRENRNFK